MSGRMAETRNSVPEDMETRENAAVRSEEKAQPSCSAVWGCGGSGGEAGAVSESRTTSRAWPAEMLGNGGI